MANSTFYVKNGLVVDTAESTFNSNVMMQSNLTVNSAVLVVNGDLIVGNDSLGGTSNLTVTGELNVQGNVVYANSQIAGDLVPTIDGLDLGNTSNRFDSFLGNTTVYGLLHPSGNTVELGNSTNRWVLSANGVDSSGDVDITGYVNATSHIVGGGTLTITGNVTINTSSMVLDAVNNQLAINTASLGTDVLTAVGTANITGNTVVGGDLDVTANATANIVHHGNAAYTYATTVSVPNTDATSIDTFTNSEFKAVKYHIYAEGTGTNTSFRHSIEISALNAGADILQTQYGEVFNTSLGSWTISKNTNATDVNLVFTGNNDSSFDVTFTRTVTF